MSIMSKGVTVEATILVRAEGGLLPRPEADIEEERRLTYVAMSRWGRFRYVTWSARRTGLTTRAGAPRVQQRRSVSRFLRNGPVQSRDGDNFIAEHWG